MGKFSGKKGNAGWNPGVGDSLCVCSDHFLKISPYEASREENVYMAKLTEQVGQYEEIVEFIKKQKEESHGIDDHVVSIREYKSKVTAKLTRICDSILRLLNSLLIPSSTTGVSISLQQNVE
ncbi:hypothetical protein SUGI_0148100 [Cryptomeria japonica]|nr:hypothetical protein SUGI_0148100 [Cryptomeria japonica]